MNNQKNIITNNIIIAPAPWKLTGYGYIILFKFPTEFLKKEVYIHPFLNKLLKFGIGGIILVNYTGSNVGPYKELLFIPGIFKYKKRYYFSISKIYVSTLASIINGQRNWGIPKEPADFKIENIENEERIIISKENKMIMDITFTSGKLILPLNNKFFPLPFMQYYLDKLFFYKLSGKGKGKFSEILDIKVNKEYFPDIMKIEPLTVIKIEDFQIDFPGAKIINNIPFNPERKKRDTIGH
jgi:hypothetical protein